MMIAEDKLDVIMDKVTDLSISMKGVEERLNAVEESLKRQEECQHEVVEVRLKLAEIEGERRNSNSIWTKFQPFLVSLFTMILTASAAFALHVWK